MVLSPETNRNGPRRDKAPAAPTIGTPRNNNSTQTKPASNGRVTPVRPRIGEGPSATFTTANAAWGYETPTNKILSNVPSTITVRSSERRRRLKDDDPKTSPDKGFGPANEDSRPRAPAFDPVGPKSRQRSDSTASAKSENTFPSRSLTKVPSFVSERPASKDSLKPAKNDNFFHARDQQEKRTSPPQDNKQSFFFPSNTIKGSIPSMRSVESFRVRPMSTSQYSSFSPAKEVGPHSSVTEHIVSTGNSPPSLHSLIPSSPPSPLRVAFSGHISPTMSKITPTTAPPRSSPPSPLKTSFASHSRSSSSSPEHISSNSSQGTSNDPNSLSSTPLPTLESDTSEDDEVTTKPLLPPTSDLENSARINRKIADLEISNSSLLAVNKNLERLSREQSLEIKSLRKQLRQSLRLSVSGRRNSLQLEEVEEESSEDESDGEDQTLEMEAMDGAVEFRLALDKSILLVEQMLLEARKGLEYQVQTSDLPSGRVLSAEWKEDLL